MKSPSPDDALTFEEEIQPDLSDSPLTWRILVVDDEPDVHKATLIAFRGMLIEGRTLEFIHAHSASEARSCLRENSDLAVALVDVVMESDDAGLKLIRYIREELGDQEIRIILRTGQPGYAPEIDTIRSYDINDFTTKSDLTRTRLFTSMTVAIRSYWQIHQLEANRRGLELIVAASSELSKPRGLSSLAEGIVMQICALLGVEQEGVVCAATGVDGLKPYVLAAAGRFSGWIGQSLSSISCDNARLNLEKSLANRCHFLGEPTSLYFSGPGSLSLAVFVRVGRPLSEMDRDLLDVFCNNISVAFENTQLLQEVSDLAFKDPLLKLPNRNGFLTQIDQRPAQSDLLALVDIDGFADINSILDQNFGDAVLRVVAHRLRHTLPPDVQVARIGGDIFGLLGSHGQVNANRIEEIFSRPFDVGDESLRLSVTCGLVCLEESSQKSVELLKNAGVALKQAKSLNRGKALFFEVVHATAARERMQMLSRLRLAFSMKKLFVVFQPFVNLANRKIVGAEALLRWRMDNGELVPPERFIPLAEQSGLMVPIGDWVAQAAIRFLKRLLDLGYRDFRMAINVSQVQFREPDFVQKLVAAIHENGVNPGNVEIELTESVALETIDLIKQKLTAVHSAGMAIAIDDFGTGYSSLNILRQLNVDRLKIDTAFVSGEDGMNVDFGIANMVVQLATHLGLETIAEGIETREQYEKMSGLGCREGQGYFLSRPVSRDEFERMIQSN